MREKVNQFWKLLSSSDLMSPSAVQDLIAKSKNDATLADDLERLTRWLVDKGVVTEYQASVLANGQTTNFRFGEYQLLDRVRVADGTTDFLARHASNYYVLLKFLKGVDQDDALRWRAVRIRGDLIAECDSPYLSACFQTVKLAQHRMVVCEAPAGKKLAKMLPAKSRLPSDQAFPIGMQLALAVQQLHDQGVTHKAICPATINLISKTEARLVTDPLYVDVNWLGTQSEDLQASVLRFRAPEIKIDQDATSAFEQATFVDSSTSAADVYSIGALLFRMTAGKNIGDVPHDQVAGALEQREFPEWFVETIENLVCQDPEARMSAKELVAVFEVNGVELPDEESSEAQQKFEFRKAISSLIPTEEVEELEAPELGEPRQLVAEAEGALAIFADDPNEDPVDAEDRIAKAQASIQRRQKRKWMQPLLVLAGCLALGGFFAGVYHYGDQIIAGSAAATDTQSNKPVQPRTSRPIIAASTEVEVVVAPPPVVQTLIADDGSTIWETPTLGDRINLDYLPPAPKIILHANPKRLLEEDEGQRLLQAMGEPFADLIAGFENTVGLPLAEVDQLLLSYHQTEQDQYQWFAVVQCSQSREQLKDAWGELTIAKSLDDKQIFEGDAGLSYFFVDDETVAPASDVAPVDDVDTDETVALENDNPQPLDPPAGSFVKFLVGQNEVVRSVVDLGFGYPVAGSLQTLQKSSDGQRHLSLMFLRPSLFNDRGQNWMGDNLSAFNRQLSEIIPDEVRGGMLSFHVADGNYFEVMLDRRVDISAEELETRIQEGITDRLQGLVALTQRIPPNEYWQAVQNRFAGMLSSLTDGFRWSSEGKQLVGNVWLPPMAAHNLIAASELVAAFQRTAVDPNSGGEQVPQSLAELMLVKRDLDIANPPDLNVLMADLEQEVNGDYSALPFKWRIVLLGADLEKDGITKNQRPGPLKLSQKSFEEILTSIVVSANPDADITGAADPNCKLIWVVAPDPENPEQQAILITTRAAAEQKAYQLPDPFVN